MGDWFTRTQLASLDWDALRQPESHPLKVRVTPEAVFDRDSGVLLASAAPGYRFFYGHDHVHIAPVDWNHEKVAAELQSGSEPTTQIAKPITSIGPDALAMLFSAVSKPPQKAVTNAQ